MTYQEDKVWDILRDRRFDGFKFRRQHAIGNYVVDFYCAQKKVIVELDGKFHRGRVAKIKDRERDNHFINRGYQVIRVWNSLVDRNFKKFISQLEAV